MCNALMINDVQHREICVCECVSVKDMYHEVKVYCMCACVRKRGRTPTGHTHFIFSHTLTPAAEVRGVMVQI